MIRLSIHSDDDRLRSKFNSFWDNLFEAADLEESNRYHRRKTHSYLFKWREVDQYVLENFNGRVIYEETDLGEEVAAIEFETEEDATLFLLRWS